MDNEAKDESTQKKSLYDVLDKADVLELQAIINKKDKERLEAFFANRKEELEQSGFNDKYLFYLFCFQFKIM